MENLFMIFGLICFLCFFIRLIIFFRFYRILPNYQPNNNFISNFFVYYKKKELTNAKVIKTVGVLNILLICAFSSFIIAGIIFFTGVYHLPK